MHIEGRKRGKTVGQNQNDQNHSYDQQDYRLHPDHLRDLQRSGLSNEIIREAKIYSLNPDDIFRKTGFNDPRIESVMAFPYPGCDGFERYKIFPPQDGRKYIQTKGSPSHLYIIDRIKPIL